jgi:molecular chaperone DnaK
MPAPRGIPQIEVTLDIDANGVLSVSAKDNATGKENKIRIEGGSQLSKDEIERMKKEAEENAEADRIEKEKIDKLNMADNMIFQTEKQIKEFDEKLTSDDKTELESILNELRESHKSGSVDQIDAQLSKLSETWSRISTNLYSQTQSQESGTEQSQDIPYEEVK